MSTEPQLFTVEEANALIPRLELIMGRMQRLGIELRHAIEAMARETDEPMMNVEVAQLLERRPELQALVEELEHCIAEIAEQGAHFKGLELGLVDFPGEIDGQLGLLCWQYGEKETAHWHSLDAACDQRQLLPSANGRSFLQ